MIMGLVNEAVERGASAKRACRELGIHPTTLQRWTCQDIGEDRRAGPMSEPKSKLSAKERAAIIKIVCSPEFRNLSPYQIVSLLADRGVYIASESTIHRILREKNMMKHRGRAKEPTKRHRPPMKIATAPRQLWSWDITYLSGPVRGTFYYLYLVMDVWSRKIVG
ncbi:MAG: putative transposase [Planctomycetota bacterium]|jgi:putative transposase